jgi:hypothetical protein
MLTGLEVRSSGLWQTSKVQCECECTTRAVGNVLGLGVLFDNLPRA